ncbi:MAG: stringent starvation protein B [Phenylobacterium sp.]|jgi:stringent starvation protein B
MSPKEPYLIRAFHEWILDNDCTPYLVVDSRQANVMVPEQFIQPDGQITLNISPGATGNLIVGNEAIEFNARFSGVPHHLYIPCSAVLAIFAKETGEGTGFAVAPPAEASVQPLRPVVAAVPSISAVEAVSPVAPVSGGAQVTPISIVPTASTEPTSNDEPPAKKPKKKGSHLSVVK